MSDMNNTVDSEYTVENEDESEVPLEAQMVVPLQSRYPTSASVEVPVIVRLDPASFDLPNDWVVEQRYRSSPKYAKRSDKFFYEPYGGKMFRSLKAAKKHIEEEKAKMDVQDEEAPQG